MLQYELSTVHRILGPWYHSQRSRSSNNHRQAANDAHDLGRSPLSTDDIDPRRYQDPAAQSTPTRQLPAVATSPSELASYFPPVDGAEELLSSMESLSLEGQNSASPAFHQRSRSTPSQAQTPSSSSAPVSSPPRLPPSSLSNGPTPAYLPTPYYPAAHPQPVSLAGHVYPPPSQQTAYMSPVAPLNLSTTLEGTFSSVRDSIVTLSAAVDSMGRQNDIALTTEGMRTKEEILSLKSVIHGLRLQIHAMMTERNAQVMGRDAGMDAGSGSSSSVLSTSLSVGEGFWPPGSTGTGIGIPPPHPFAFRSHPSGYPPLARSTKL